MQSVGQLSYIRPFVTDFSPLWLAESTATLTAGAMILVHVRPEPCFPCLKPYVLKNVMIV